MINRNVMVCAIVGCVGAGGIVFATPQESGLFCQPTHKPVLFDWPHFTMCYLETSLTNYPGGDADCDGVADVASGSGVLIGPCTVLSCAHLFFNRNAIDCMGNEFRFRFSAARNSDHRAFPAAFVSSATGQRLSLGVNVASQVGVAAGYTIVNSFGRHMRRDIGFMRLEEPVLAMRTFMGLQVDGLSVAAADMHVAGYSDFFDQPGDSFSDLRRGTTANPAGSNEFHNYGVIAYLGISGGARWDSLTNRIIGVHAYDMVLLCSGGPRFGGGKNESIARSIFALDCLSGKVDEDLFETTPWDVVRQESMSDPSILVPMNELRMVDFIPDYPQPPSRRVLQVIENVIYEWNEWDVPAPPGGGASLQMVEMILPEFGGLNRFDAQALLSASRNWGIVRGHLPPDVIFEPFTPAPNRLGLEYIELEMPQEGEQDDPSVPDLVFLVDAPLPGDMDGDGEINGQDIGAFLGEWGNQGGAADFNLDGLVDSADMGILLANWTG